MTKIASGGITLTSVEDPFMAHSTNPSFVIKENYDGSDPQLSEAYTNITCGKGDTKLKFSISFQSCSSADINYKTEFSSDGYTLKLSITSIPTTITGGSITLTITSGDSSQDVVTSFSTVRETATLEWIKDWNTRATQISLGYVVTPKIFAGAVSENKKLFGVYLGPDPTDADNSGCILGYNNDNIIFKLGNNGNYIGGWNIGKDSLTSGGISINSSERSICVGPSDNLDWKGIERIKNNGGVYIYHTSDSDYGIAGYNKKDTEYRQTFRLGNENKIAGWNFDHEAIWTGDKNNNIGEVVITSGITIGTNGMRGTAWRIDNDGSGSFAWDKIYWDTKGNITVDGKIISKEGEIGGWSIQKDGIKTDHVYFYSTGQLIHTEGKTVFWNLAADGSGSFAQGNIKWNVDGSGSIAGGSIAWNTDGSGSVAKGKISWTDKGDCSFDGKITSSSGKIGGWTIDSTTISNSSITIDSEGEIACVIVTATDRKVAWSLQDDGTGVLAFGNIKWDEDGAGSLANGNITWTKDGACAFNGEITAASGTIAGWTIGKDSLTGGGVTLSKDGLLSNVIDSVTFWSFNTDGSGVLAKGNISWGTDGNVSLKNIKAKSGSIGSFVIDSESDMIAYSSDKKSKMLLSYNLVRFTDESNGVGVYMGTTTTSSVFPNWVIPLRISNSRVYEDKTYIGANLGIRLDISGCKAYDDDGMVGTGSHALYIAAGDICGFRKRTRRITSSSDVGTTLSPLDSNVILPSGTADYRVVINLPSDVEDGQEYYIYTPCPDATSHHGGYVTINHDGTYTNLSRSRLCEFDESRYLHLDYILCIFDKWSVSGGVWYLYSKYY